MPIAIQCPYYIETTKDKIYCEICTLKPITINEQRIIVHKWCAADWKACQFAQIRTQTYEEEQNV